MALVSASMVSPPFGATMTLEVPVFFTVYRLLLPAAVGSVNFNQRLRYIPGLSLRYRLPSERC